MSSPPDPQRGAVPGTGTGDGRKDLVGRRITHQDTPAVNLSDDEVVRLGELEVIVDTAIASVIEAGRAFAEIRDRRLYRATHDTYEQFVLDRWGFSARRARQLAAAADIVDALPSGTAVPESERAIRELSPIRADTELLAEAVTIAAADHRGLTADSIRAAVAELRYRAELIAGIETMFPGIEIVFDRVLLREIVTVQMAAERFHDTGVMRPTPPWWPADDDFAVAVQNKVAEFIAWCEDVGFDESTFDVFRTEGPEVVAEMVDAEAAARWWPTASIDEARSAALGHWFQWNTSRTAPAVHRDLVASAIGGAS